MHIRLLLEVARELGGPRQLSPRIQIIGMLAAGMHCHSVLAILPVVARMVMVVEWILGHLSLSLFQLNVLGLLIAASAAEFLLTIWIRFVVNRRTIGFGMS